MSNIVDCVCHLPAKLDHVHGDGQHSRYEKALESEGLNELRHYRMVGRQLGMVFHHWLGAHRCQSPYGLLSTSSSRNLVRSLEEQKLGSPSLTSVWCYHARWSCYDAPLVRLKTSRYSTYGEVTILSSTYGSGDLTVEMQPGTPVPRADSNWFLLATCPCSET